MGDDSKASCLTASSTIAVAVVGAVATILAAIIMKWNPSPPPTPTPAPTAAPTATINQLIDPTPAPPSPSPTRRRNERRPTLAGFYVLQGQNVVPSMQAEMTLAEEGEGEFSWTTDYFFHAAPQYRFRSHGTLVNSGNAWLLSMHESNDPSAALYEDIPVGVAFNGGVLNIAINAGQGYTWVKR